MQLNRANSLVIFAGFCALILIGSLVKKPNNDDANRDNVSTAAPTAAPARTTIPIRYVVDGRPEHASITYQNADGGTSQVSKAKVPWSLDFQAKPGTFLYLSAQEGSGNDRSAITATIYVDGFKFKSSTSAGAYVIASASGSVPKP